MVTYVWGPQVVILIKVLILIKSLLAFLLTSTVTALIVRMLMSSGVILMFPLFYCLRSLGCATLDYHLLTLSYPWLGVRKKPRECSYHTSDCIGLGRE